MSAKFENSMLGSVIAVACQGRLDSVSAPLFEAHCRKCLMEQSGKSVIVDLHATDYMSSAGLRSLLILGKLVKGQGGRMAICGLQPLVRETFALSGFLNLFPVAETQDHAAKLLGAGGAA